MKAAWFPQMPSTCGFHFNAGDYMQSEKQSCSQKSSPEACRRGTKSSVSPPSGGNQEGPREAKSVLFFYSVINCANFGMHFLKSTPQSGLKDGLKIVTAFKMSLPKVVLLSQKQKEEGKKKERERQNRLSSSCLWNGNTLLT